MQLFIVFLVMLSAVLNCHHYGKDFAGEFLYMEDFLSTFKKMLSFQFHWMIHWWFSRPLYEKGILEVFLLNYSLH